MNMNSETGSNLIHMLGTPREKQQCGIAIKFLGMWKLYFSGQDMWSKAEFPNVKLSGRQSFIFKNFTTVGENFSHLKTSDRFFFFLSSVAQELICIHSTLMVSRKLKRNKELENSGKYVCFWQKNKP